MEFEIASATPPLAIGLVTGSTEKANAAVYCQVRSLSRRLRRKAWSRLYVRAGRGSWCEAVRPGSTDELWRSTRLRWMAITHHFLNAKKQDQNSPC